MAQPTRVPLSGGAYTARDVIASAQSCVNLFGEKNPEDAAVRLTYYPTPGLVLAGNWFGPCRCLYVTGRGLVFAVFGSSVCTITAGNVINQIGSITLLTTPVRMQDNGLVLVIVDGTLATAGVGGGWYLNLTTTGAGYTGPVTLISDPAWQGSTTIGIIDSFLAFNVPGSNEFYLSPSNWVGGVAFDALYVATKSTYPDKMTAVISVGAMLWLFGIQTTEIWYDAGAADFPLARMEGVLIPFGCTAPYSIATIAGTVYWLAHDQHGHMIVMAGFQYSAQRISTHALEYVWQTYTDAEQATGTTYQQGGHTFYVLNFPISDVTWCFDAVSEEWHQRVSMDSAGVWHQWAASFVVNALGNLVAAGPGSANLYTLSPTVGTENGLPIVRQRSFAHMMSNGVRGIYWRFGIDLNTYGTSSATFNLAWSDDRGQTFPNTVPVTINSSDQEFPSIFRLGMSRDRVFQVNWTDPNISALNGAFVWVEASHT